VVNRRQSLRRLLILPPVRVSLGDFSQELMFDLSEGGLSVYGRLASLGRRSFPVKFRLPGDENPITTRGEVAWTARNRTGVRFVDFPSFSRSRLRNWLATKLPPALPYPADYKSGWVRRASVLGLPDRALAWLPNRLGRPALVLGLFLGVFLIGAGLGHFPWRAVQKDRPESGTDILPQTHMPEISGQVLAAQPPTSAPSVPSQASPQTASPSVTATPALARGFVLQVGALKRGRNADDLSNFLKQRGFPVMVSKSPTDALYRVVVGPYPDISSAVRVKNDLKAWDVEGFVRPWTPE